MNRRSFLKLSSVLPGYLLAGGQRTSGANHPQGVAAPSKVYFGDSLFDSVKDGFRPGEFTLVAGHFHPDRARQFTLRLVRNAIHEQGKTVLVVGVWFPQDAPTRILGHEHRSTEGLKRLVYQYNCWDSPAVIQRGIEETVKTRSIDLIVMENIDYLGRSLDERKQPRTVAATIFDVRNIAKNLNIPVVGATELAKQAYNRRDKRPYTTDLTRDTDLACDSLVLLYAERDYDRSSTNTKLDAIVAKNLNGLTGVASLEWRTEIEKV